jgi:hypothetical protein
LRKRQSKDRSRTGDEMSVPRSIAEVLAEHVTLEVEGIDRMYRNVYVCSSKAACIANSVPTCKGFALNSRMGIVRRPQRSSILKGFIQ